MKIELKIVLREIRKIRGAPVSHIEVTRWSNLACFCMQLDYVANSWQYVCPIQMCNTEAIELLCVFEICNTRNSKNMRGSSITYLVLLSCF